MVKPLEAVDELDRWIYGAENIGIVVDLDPRETYHALERGYLDADKFGRKWRSTKRRLLKPAAPTPAALPAELPQGTEHHAATADTVA
jgi:hypothetical protein